MKLGRKKKQKKKKKERRQNSEEKLVTVTMFVHSEYKHNTQLPSSEKNIQTLGIQPTLINEYTTYINRKHLYLNTNPNKSRHTILQTNAPILNYIVNDCHNKIKIMCNESKIESKT